MKVMHLLPALEQGGVERVVTALNRVAAESGWESVVVSAGGRLVAEIEGAGGRHVRMDVKSKNPLTFLPRVLALRRLLRSEKPDLVCAHSRVPAWLFVFANRPLDIPWITYAHGANSVSAYSKVMTRGDLTVTPSRYLADFLKDNYGLAEEKIRVIHPAVDTARFDPQDLDSGIVEAKRREWGLETGDRVVMAVGRITPVKGYDALIRSVAELRERHADVKLVIVGDADGRHKAHLEELCNLAESAGLGRAVVFAGGESKVPECLSLASVVVSSNTRKPETFGLSMAEALAMDRPVVAKAFGGALEIVRDGEDGVLFARDDGLADAIEKALNLKFSGLRERVKSRFAVEESKKATCSAWRLVAGKVGP